MTTLLEWERKGQSFIGTPEQFLGELTYTSYRHARQQSPHLSVDGWRVIYGAAVPQLEARYQQEVASCATVAIKPAP